MNNLKTIVDDLLMYDDELEWFDFKENWFSKDEIGEYISAISNSAVIANKEYGYLIWGIEDKTHNIVGTTINFDRDIDGEPYKHYLARNLYPSISFNVHELLYDSKRLIILEIPAAKSIPTSFKKVRYTRIGSSKEKIERFPEREVILFDILKNGSKTIVNTEAPDYAQDLTFEKLFMYYAAKGLTLKPETFKKNLKLLTKDNKYNIMAMILADNNNIPVRVSIFNGKEKSDPLFSVKEYGNTCILFAMDKILEYGDAINIVQADERNRISERKEIPLFDYEAYHEAVLNAFVHNKWLGLNAPMISVFTDRIEILSYGTLASKQNIQGFYDGVSLPVNDILASIFLQLKISERSGRGVPKIIKRYGKEAYKFNENSIVVTIPFEKINVVNYKLDEKVYKKVDIKLNKTQEKIIDIIQDNPNITVQQLVIQLNLSTPAVKKNLKHLSENNIIERVGAKNGGYWQIKQKDE